MIHFERIYSSSTELYRILFFIEILNLNSLLIYEVKNLYFSINISLLNYMFETGNIFIFLKDIKIYINLQVLSPQRKTFFRILTVSKKLNKLREFSIQKKWKIYWTILSFEKKWFTQQIQKELIFLCYMLKLTK